MTKIPVDFFHFNYRFIQIDRAYRSGLSMEKMQIDRLIFVTIKIFTTVTLRGQCYLSVLVHRAIK